MINRNMVVFGIIILAVLGIGGYYVLTTVAGYGFEVYGTVDLESWTIVSCDTTNPTNDYSILRDSSSDHIEVLETNEVILVVQIDDKTFEQNLGPYADVTNTTFTPYYNVIVKHLQKGTYDYTIFLYETTGLFLKSRILRDQMDGSVTVP